MKKNKDIKLKSPLGIAILVGFIILLIAALVVAWIAGVNFSEWL